MMFVEYVYSYKYLIYIYKNMLPPYAIVLLQACVFSMLLRHLGSAGHFRHSTFGRITFQEMDTYHHIPPGVKKKHQT